MQWIWIIVAFAFFHTSAFAQDTESDVPNYRGTIGVTYPNGPEFTDFLEAESGKRVYLDMVLLLDVATAYNFQLAQLCSSEDDRSLSSLTPFEVPKDIGNLLGGKISGREIPMPKVFSEDGDWRSVLSGQGLFPEVAVDCYSNRLRITAADNDLFRFNSGGTGIAFYSFKGLFDVLSDKVGPTTYFDLVYVSEAAANARNSAGAQ